MRRRKRKIYSYVNGLTSGIRLKQPCTRPMGYQRIAIELLCSSVVAKSEEYAVSGIAKQLNTDNLQLRVTGKVHGNINVRAAAQKIFFFFFFF